MCWLPVGLSEYKKKKKEPVSIDIERASVEPYEKKGVPFTA